MQTFSEGLMPDNQKERTISSAFDDDELFCGALSKVQEVRKPEIQTSPFSFSSGRQRKDALNSSFGEPCFGKMEEPEQPKQA